MDIAAVRSYLLGLQQRIVDATQAEDGTVFATDAWTRPSGGALEGDGVTRLVEEGGLLERGGCNFSHVRGRSLPASATQHRAHLAGAPVRAMRGVSWIRVKCPTCTPSTSVMAFRGPVGSTPIEMPRSRRRERWDGMDSLSKWVNQDAVD